jgi:hypothetical protein
MVPGTMGVGCSLGLLDQISRQISREAGEREDVAASGIEVLVHGGQGPGDGVEQLVVLGLDRGLKDQVHGLLLLTATPDAQRVSGAEERQPT